jgi:hypothetical protein
MKAARRDGLAAFAVFGMVVLGAALAVSFRLAPLIAQPQLFLALEAPHDAGAGLLAQGDRLAAETRDFFRGSYDRAHENEGPVFHVANEGYF